MSTPSWELSARGIGVFVPRLLGLYRYGRISDPGMAAYPPRLRRDFCVGPWGNSRLDEPQPINNHPVGLGFPHLAGRYRPGAFAFASLRCWSRKDMQGFLVRVWEIILPGCGGTSWLARGAILAARRLHKPQPISNHPVGLGFPHPAGRYRPGG